MNAIDRPPVGPGRAGRAPDDLDGLLRDFFEAELPVPWPGCEPLVVRQPAKSPGWQRTRSRLALAASIALLLGGSCWLSGIGPGAEPTPPGGGGPIIGTGPKGPPRPPGTPGHGKGSQNTQHGTKAVFPAGKYR